MSTNRFIDSLESRVLFAWGPFPHLINQDAEQADFPTVDGRGITIVEIDSGMSTTHPVLANGKTHLVFGWNYINNNSDISDGLGHGTGIAGILNAAPWDYGGYHYSGLAPGANLIVLKQDSSQQIKSALQWCIANRDKYNIQVIDVTDFLGASYHPNVYSPEAKTLYDEGVFIASPAGNLGADVPIAYPGADPSIFCTGAIDQFDKFATFNQRGPALDFLAPGKNVTVPYFDTATSTNVVTGYAEGTSWANAHISGTAALIKSIDPSITPDEIAKIIKDSGVPKWDPISQANYPRVDVDAAVKLAIARLNQPGKGATYNSIAFDQWNRLHVAFYDPTTQSLKYAIRDANGVWGKTYTLDKNGVGQYCSVAIDNNGDPGVAYFDATNGRLVYQHLHRKVWTKYVVDTGNVGYWASLKFDSVNRPAMAYYDGSNRDLKFAGWGKTSWVIRTIDSYGNTGLYPSLAMNPSAHTWAIAYVDASFKTFRYAAQNNSGRWGVTNVKTSTATGGYVSLAFDKNSRPAFSFYDGSQKNLQFAHYNGTSWQIGDVADNPPEGLYSNVVFNSAGKANIYYYSKSFNSAFSAQGDVGSWSYGSLTTSGGTFLSIAVSPDGSVTACWKDSSTGNLRFVDL